MPTLRQFHYLVALADLGHFGRAAVAAHVSQPTLSQQLRALEQRLGVTLVERRLAGAELTPIGREIAERARRILVGVEDIRALAGRAAEGAAGVIRLGVTPTLGPYLMPQIVAALHREQPDLRLYIREGIPGEQARELARGQLDMLLSPLPIAGGELAVEPLLRERLLLVAPEEHPLAKRGRIARADLAGLPILSLDHRHHFHRQVARLCEEDAMVLLRDYEGTSLDSVRQMVGSGLGFAILPDLYIRSEVGGSAGVQVLEVEGWTPSRSLAAAWRRGAAMGPTYLAIARRIEAAAAEIIAA
ncbi:hydrogen peroxide-inducible genes activator [Qipengyuania sediminis]|uniref:hydrogen peroxide-inducible genes activator n=1 Tax=Qipengyuania sediminis TaxID=1532023 RepID=UPI0010592E62|nr:hydrogen peroxide-inducible genes activator [Qipengyuania sediminis]